ncbi:hypothetical protein [Streptomyces mirabilis]|uniref:hypothetical protein n=1 Tax=Streptomyces mirabilis TaxID=68239 RepID=UPI0033F49974
MALLTGYAYERDGVAASIAVHLGVNGTTAVLGAGSPSAQASVVAVQSIVAITLLAWQRDRPADQSSVHVDPHVHQLVASGQSDPRLINSGGPDTLPAAPVDPDTPDLARATRVLPGPGLEHDCARAAIGWAVYRRPLRSANA